MNFALTLFRIVGVAAQSIFWNIFWMGVVVSIVITLSILGLGYLAVKLLYMIPAMPWF